MIQHVAISLPSFSPNIYFLSELVNPRISYHLPQSNQNVRQNSIRNQTGNHEKASCQIPDSVIPQLVTSLRHTNYRVVGSSNGLVCLYGDHRFVRGGHTSPTALTAMAVVWNPSVRKAVGVIVPYFSNGMYWTDVGFGVCGETMDPKIVKITFIIVDEKEIDIPSQVEVFTLSTGVWRSPYGNLPRKAIQFDLKPQVVVDGFLYWLASEKITRDGGYSMYYYSLIVSFDMTTEEFGEVNLPDSLALAIHTNKHVLQINRLRNSLVVIDYNQNVNDPIMDVWMRVDGVFTKLFDLMVNGRNELIRGFRKNGAPIVQTLGYNRELVVYEPSSKNMDSVWVHDGWASVYPYMETLLLLDHPDFMVYNDIHLVYNDIPMWRMKKKRLLKHTS